MMIALVATTSFTLPAFADALEDHCIAYNEATDGDPSGCACLDEAAQGDVEAELIAAQSPSDFENLSEAAQEIVAMCYPNPS